MGYRIAIMRMGAWWRIDTPDNLWPRRPIVRCCRLVGADRGLKRLSVGRLTTLTRPLLRHHAPAAPSSTSLARRALADAHRGATLSTVLARTGRPGLL